MFLARDAMLDRDVALALISAGALDQRRADRVRREPQAMGRPAAHPNLVTVYDTGEAAGAPDIVEEHLDGGTVADLHAQTNPPARPLPIERVVRIAADVCAAHQPLDADLVLADELLPAPCATYQAPTGIASMHAAIASASSASSASSTSPMASSSQTSSALRSGPKRHVIGEV